MISPKKIKKAYLSILKKVYPDIKIYGVATVEGYTVPSFFVRSIGLSVGNKVGKNIMLHQYLIDTTYFQLEADEVDAYEKIDRIREAVGDYLNVEGKKVAVNDFEFNFTGKNNDILQITFHVRFYTKRERNEEKDFMQEIFLEQYLRRRK